MNVVLFSNEQTMKQIPQSSLPDALVTHGKMITFVFRDAVSILDSVNVESMLVCMHIEKLLFTYVSNSWHNY